MNIPTLTQLNFCYDAATLHFKALPAHRPLTRRVADAPPMPRADTTMPCPVPH